MSAPRCGRPTRKGTPCRCFLINGKCMTHDCDLTSRNQRVAASFHRRNPAAFRAQRRAAGKRGYAATGGAKGWEVANEKAREWRVAHPSGPEQWALEVLTQAGLNHYQREYLVAENTTLDIAWPQARMGVEINGHQSMAAFGETTPRAQHHAEKITAIESAGWRVLVIDTTGDRVSAAMQLIQFAQQANLASTL